MGLSGQILRGVKIAAYVFAALLAWTLVRDFLESPSDPAPTAESGKPAEPSWAKPGPANVPPPPPLPGESRTSRRGQPVPKPRVETQEAVHIREVNAVEIPPPLKGELGDAPGSASPPPAPAVTNNQEQAGIVIVVPPGRSTQESRGRRWARAVGRALHIGSQE